MFAEIEKAIEAEFPIAGLVKLLEALPDVVRRRVQAAEDKAAADVKTIATWAEKAIADLKTETDAALEGKVKAAIDKVLGGIDLSAAKTALADLAPPEKQPEVTVSDSGQAVEVEHA